MKPIATQHWLFIFRRTPYCGLRSQEAVDALLAASACCKGQLHCLFDGDGVWQLLAKQNASAIAQKNVSRLFEALDLYDINGLYVSQQALTTCQLDTADLIGEPTVLEDTAIRTLIHQHNVVLQW